jgi:imidazolonepropionase-like amidohydrolase
MRQTDRGFIVGGFTDHHVHLQLVDHALLADSVLGRVIDLGGNPAVLAAAQTGVEVAFAGAFLTPRGGYPSMRAWAPEGSVREIADADAAARAVASMKNAGAVCIKVASNSVAGSVFSDDMLQRIIELATDQALPVIAHAEGQGEAQRVADLGVDLLAHAPFSERLDDDEIAVQAASVQWISTLAIHTGPTYEIAVDNVRRFYAAGGMVLYGTDMGNGPATVGLNEREVRALRQAGIEGDALIRALAPIDEGSRLFIPGDVPDPLLARPLTPADLEE